MIILVEKLPEISALNAELVKIKCLYDSYPNDEKVMFWIQDNNRALISMTDGNMVIYNNNADLEELKDFVNMLSPVCVFSDYETLLKLDRKPKEKINVMHRKADIIFEKESDSLSSKEIYDLLNTEGLVLPEYPYFAVDYCHRLNKGMLDYFAIKDKCAAVTFKTKGYAIMNGIASREKGFGSLALKGALNKNFGREFLVCCREKIKGFYEKEGFDTLYYAGYWIREI